MKIYPKCWTNDYLTNYFMKISSDEIKKEIIETEKDIAESELTKAQLRKAKKYRFYARDELYTRGYLKGIYPPYPDNPF